MKIKTLIVIIILLISTFVKAQDAPNSTDAKGRKQGHWIKYDDKNKKMYDGNFVDNVPVGKFTYYYDTGVPWAITVFSNNGKTARTKMFNGNGKLSAEGKYIDQKKDSIWLFYNQDEKKISDEIYVNGLKNGNCIVYFDNGQLAEEKYWKNGVPDGPWKKYFENGQLKYNGFHVNDKVEGKTTFYYPSGKIDCEGMYVEDVKDGDWKYYNEDGSMKSTVKFIKGHSTNESKDYIPLEKVEKQKQESQQLEFKDPFQEGYTPR